MKQFYIGTRSDWSTMSEVAGSSVSKLNNRMSETIRSVALKQGIKKTQDRKKLEFYLVDEEQFKTLTADSTKTLVALKHGVDWHPLIAVDRELMTEAIQKVNAKYGNRMPPDVFKQYNAELEAGVEGAVVKLNEDKKITHSNTQGLKVGDIIEVPLNWRENGFAEVTKITDSGYTYKPFLANFNAYGLTLKLSQEELKARGISIHGANSQDGHCRVPFKGNEDLFIQGKAKTKRFSKYAIRIKDKDNDKVEYHHYWYCD